MDSSKLKAMNFQLALYIAMAHAGLLLLILTLYGLGLLLKDFWKPIQWAVLCSITLREIQGSLVRFWEAPLRQGLIQTLLAIPLAVCKGLAGTIEDLRATILWILARHEAFPLKVGFSKLLQWLLAFAVVTLGYDKLGVASLATAIATGLAAYAGASRLGAFAPPPSPPSSPPSSVAMDVKRSSRQQRTVTRKWLGWASWPIIRASRALNRHATAFLAARLPTIVAIGLIMLMILVSVAGLVLFSYKAGLEARDAAVALKIHVQRHNYTEMVGLRQWLEHSNVTVAIEQHSSAAYEAVSQHIDAFGVQYNLTEFTDAGKEFLVNFARGRRQASGAATIATANVTTTTTSSHPVLIRLHRARSLLRDYDLKALYSELEAVFSLLLDHLQLKPEDVRDRMKQVSETGAEIGKRVLLGGSHVVYGGTSIAMAVGSSIASGAAGIFHFLTQAAVFFSLLYYLITSQSGGVVEQVLGMIPLSETARIRSATVLNRAVSSVLLATVKSAFYQAAFTWLLFRAFGIHFLYVSTLLAIVTAVLPVFPLGVASIPAAAQLVVQGDYLAAVVLGVVHCLVLDFGNRAIQDEIPGHNAYLTGLSIAGGMALFSPALEGAIMGPLLMTVLTALKNLYCEFILHAERVAL
ncbi:uncharacterized protein LOC9642257 [Selaginella moellendorffii]|uniref:uncharacterized protein LOC9642257 n=1 Tax=Selaginella moellendorffii TaxID=88036 RepID=UPI000D1CE5B8|nr:uncharacterized protein LOC9642257 [Selaginella moellendorffii]|eukprot:XP_024533279.1 uncharacterized protein LOC9642257 [Selaginella moellendorffii]